MSKVEMNAYEAVLRMCADAAPQAWHPQQYSRRSGTPMETVNGVLSELWQEGLLEKAPGHPATARGGTRHPATPADRRLVIEPSFLVSLVCLPDSRSSSGQRTS